MSPVDLLSAMKRTVDQLAAFNDIAKALTSTLEVKEVLDLIGSRLSNLLGVKRWSLLLERDDGLLHFELVQGDGSSALLNEVLVPGEGIAGTVFSTGHPRVVLQARSDPDFAARFDAMTDTQTESLLAVPLKVRGRPIGVLELVGTPGEAPFTDDDLRAATTVSDFAAIAIDNARNFAKVQELTLTDEHTGLFNARHLSTQLDLEVARAVRFARPLSLIFLDIDKFKEINDSRGHLVGSGALKHAGGVIQSLIRGVDSAYRYGGDEFAVLLVETGLRGSNVVAGRMIEAFNSSPFDVGVGAAVPINVSVGVASFPDDGISARSLLEAADKAMYRAKSAGRNTWRRPTS
jgi:diguanylate cyclase (GGDEF)-like protein